MLYTVSGAPKCGGGGVEGSLPHYSFVGEEGLTLLIMRKFLLSHIGPFVNA